MRRLTRASPRLLTGKIELQELRQDFIVGKIGRPPVGGEHRFIEPAMGVGEPGGPLVVKICWQALSPTRPWLTAPVNL